MKEKEKNGKLVLKFMNKLRVILMSTLQAKLSNELIMRIESNRSSWHVAIRNANYTIKREAKHS